MMWSGSYADTPGDIGPEEWAALLAEAERCPDCGHRAHPETPLECGWCPEGYCEARP